MDTDCGMRFGQAQHAEGQLVPNERHVAVKGLDELKHETGRGGKLEIKRIIMKR